jgi:SNF2 family DNA or RNA helicase
MNSTIDSSSTEAPFIAEVVCSRSLDKLIVAPIGSADPRAVLSMLKTAIPRLRSSRAAQGIYVGIDDASELRLKAAGLPIVWTPPAVRYLENRLQIASTFEQVLRTVRSLRDGGVDVAAQMLPHLDAASPLDAHQIVNVAAMTIRSAPGLCLFDEQGAGKTVSMIFAFDELVRRDEIDFLLIAAPKSMVGEWPKDFHTFTEDLYKVSTLAGTFAQKVETLGTKVDVLVTNFETVVSMEAHLEALLRSYGGRCAIAVDESFFIKSPDARRTMALRRLREWCARGFVLCGTPAPNSPSDLVQQFAFVDFGYAFGEVEIPIDRELALPIVQRVVDEKGLYLRNLKSEVLPDLPGKTFQVVAVDMQPNQHQLYLAALEALSRDLSDTTDEQFRRRITNFLSQRAMLLQLCSNPAAAAVAYSETPAKLLALDRIVDQIVTHKKEKLVIWSFYTGSINNIVARYQQHGVVRYDGTVSSVDERRNSVTRFQHDEDTKIFVANPAAAGAGLTLHRAKYAVYESMSNQAAHYLQSLDRIHRRGQQREVEYFILLCRDTVEEMEYKRLLKKEAAAQTLLGDSIDPPTVRQTFLDETISLLDKARKMNSSFAQPGSG